MRARRPGTQTTDNQFAERVFRRRLVEEAFSTYLDWRDACALVKHAYRRWTDAGADDPGRAYLAYRAALDQEQRAGDLYAEACRRAERVLAGHLDVARQAA